MKNQVAKWGGVALLVVVLLFMAIQAVPYGRNHENPPVVREPTWDSAWTRAMAKRACFDCHSNETVWPWYSRVAPFSWLVYRDVVEGRDELNFSQWGGGMREGERPAKIGKEIGEGEMPPMEYLLLHPEARLTAEEMRRLAEGLSVTARQSGF